jgi:hypothetical protein
MIEHYKSPDLITERILLFYKILHMIDYSPDLYFNNLDNCISIKIH